MNPVLTRTAIQPLPRPVRVAAAMAALLITMAQLTAELARDLGGQFREALEARNDQLARWWVGVLGLAPAAAPELAPAPVPSVPLLASAPAPIALLCPAATAPRPARAPRKRKPAAATAAAPTPKPRVKKAKAPAPARRRVATT